VAGARAKFQRIPRAQWSLEIDGEPYTSAPRQFQWFRSRIVAPHQPLGRIALRFAPIDFKSGTRDGLGDDWPSPTRISLHTTTKSNPTSASSHERNVSSGADGIFLPPPKRAATN